MGHWYTKDGEAQHRMPKAKGGGTRPTTSRDAKKLGLLPSVTTILGVLDKPGLTRWQITNAVLAAMDAKGVRLEGETDGQLVYRMQNYAREKARKSAERGQQIHDALEQWMLGQPDLDYTTYFSAVKAQFLAVFPEWGHYTKEPEVIITSTKHGYGGKCDLFVDEVQLAVDYKTKDFDEDNLPKGWPEQGMQLAAYADARGYTEPTLMNVFVSRDNPGLVHYYIHADPHRLIAAFHGLCEVYHNLNPGLR